jgi:hypothetical protein
MADEKDPALEQEGTAEGSSTVADPAEATEDNAETTDASAESEASTDAPNEEPKKDEPAQVEETEIVVESGEVEEPTPKDDTAWYKMRQEQKALKAKIAEQERKLKALETPSQVDDPGPEPTLEDCDFNQETYKQRLRTWDKAVERKAAHDQTAAQQAAAMQRDQTMKFNDYLSKREQYAKTIPNYLEWESAVKAALDPDRQTLLLRYAKNPALIVGALGRMPKLLEDLARQSDIGLFAASVSELETRVKENVKKTATQAPPPEKPLRGSGAPPGTADKQLERLRAEAERTGDYTKVRQHREKLRRAQ